MSAQLEYPRPPVTARPPHTERAVASPPLRPPAAAPHGAPLDRDRGLGLLLSFVGATAVMVGDVVVVGAVGQSWILIPGFAVLLAMAAIVFIAIMRLLADSEGGRS